MKTLKTDIHPRMIAKMKAIPVYPHEVMARALSKRFGIFGIPTNAPVGEDNGWICYPDKKTKERYLAQLEELQGRIENREKENDTDIND